MSSFSIQDLLGLRGKDADHKTDAGKSTPAHDDHAAAEDDVNEDSETVHEEDVYNAAHQLVTVEVRTLHSSSTVSRSSSRKRKKREQAKEREPTPDTDGKLSSFYKI